MSLMIRFYNNLGDRIAQKSFTVEGDSLGWSGAVETSALTHRRETIVVPPEASRLWVVISSAGPPSTMGVYVVDDLIVSKVSATGETPEVLLKSPFDHRPDSDDEIPKGWVRDGTTPTMAKIIGLDSEAKKKAFAIIDSDPLGHCEWHNAKELAPPVTPNENLVVEWNELFAMGVSDNRSFRYPTLPTGHYQFEVEEVTIWGQPTGAKAILAVRVSLPYWKTPWFWVGLATVLGGLAATCLRLVARRKLQHAMLHLRQQQVLEQERLRISQDIHDDLGARVTQISLLSALAQKNPAFPEKARIEFDRISHMSQDLVSALYETVWTVNPENDNLDALGNYLCQRTNELCAQAGLRCRLHVPRLPHQVGISSRVRHNLSMAVKEAVHNVIKHARASQISIHLTFVSMSLTVIIHDDGQGFHLDGAPPGGNGLINMQRRLEDIGGRCVIESKPGEGTTVNLHLPIRSSDDPLNVPPA
jgi:signal transduction histidine kinase